MECMLFDDDFFPLGNFYSRVPPGSGKGLKVPPKYSGLNQSFGIEVYVHQSKLSPLIKRKYLPYLPWENTSWNQLLFIPHCLLP